MMKFLCVTLLTFSVFMETTSERFEVVGPAAPLVVETGSDLVLPCSLQPNISAVDMMVDWSRPDLPESITLVHLYNFNEDRNEKQLESYRGRTALFKEELQKGNTSLKLSAVQPSDQGVYKCLIRSQSWYEDTNVYVRVIVHLRVVGPAAALVVEAGSDLVLPCSLRPSVSAEGMMVEWSRDYETDTLVHLYAAHDNRNDEQMESYRGRTALFKEELCKGNTSLKLSAVQPSDEGAYKCFVRSGSWYGDITVHVEVTGNGFHAGRIAFICFAVCGVLLITFTVCILKDKFSRKQLSPVQCSAVSYMHLQSENVCNEWKLQKYNTSEEGYRRLIPAISNCRKALLSGCNLTEQSTEALAAALQSEKSSLKHLDLSNNDLQDSGVEKLSAGLKSSHCTVEELRLVECKLGQQSCSSLQSVLQSANCTLRELDLSNNEIKDSGVKLLSDGLKSEHCKLEILKLFNCNLGQQTCEDLGSVLQSANCTLRELGLSNNEIKDSGVKLISEGLKSEHCKLETLRLFNCNIGQQTCGYLGSVLQSANCTLRELDLSNNEIKDSGVKLLSDGLKSEHCKLETLRLYNCNLGEDADEDLGSVLQSANCTLRELDLSNNEIKDSGVKLLSDGLKSEHCKLETLRLSGSKLSAESWQSLTSAVKSGSVLLKELDLTNNDLHAVDTHFSVLQDLQLQILRLSMCNLGRNSCENLGSVLRSANCTLKELDLSNNDLQDSGVKLISDGLKSSHCKLETLRLSGCLVTGEGCSSLASALSSSSHLKELDLTYNHPGDSGEKLFSDLLQDPHSVLKTLRLDYAGSVRLKPGLRKYACDITLDPNTTHPRLVLSEENRKVTWGRQLQSYPDHAERFDECRQVLSVEELSGRCYWEAEYSDDADFAVTYNIIKRKGGSDECGFGRNINSWRLYCSDNIYSVWHNNNKTEISVPCSSNRVGVYVDCAGGTLSFYSVSSDTHHTLTHLHTFHSTFTHTLHAGLYVYYDSSVSLCQIE